jgi:hypothetical protein
MTRSTWLLTLVGAALLAAPLAAQDSIAPIHRDTTKAKPAAPAAPAAPAQAPAAAPAAPAAAAQPPATAQGDSSNAIRPGMSQADVIAHWGQPVAVRRMNDWTYLFYRNGDERHWGYYDTVFLQNGQVMDAIVRSPDHVYAGQSSSPEGREVTPPRRPAPDSGRAAVTGVRVQPGR